MLATDLEKVAKTGCLVKKREAGDVWAPSGTFHGTAVGDASLSLSLLILSLCHPTIHLFSLVEALLSFHLVCGGFS